MKRQVRDVNVNVRMTQSDYQRLVERAKRARAKTPSAYIRAAALTGREFELPCWDVLRAVMNEVLKLTGEIQRSPPGPVRDRALEKAMEALDRITRF